MSSELNHQLLAIKPRHRRWLVGKPGIDKVRIMGAFVEGHNYLVISDLDLPGNIQQAVEKDFCSGIVVVLRKMLGKQAI